MTEHIISDERLWQNNRAAYRAGAGGSVAYTQVGADGPAVVRCRDCFSARFEGGKASPLCMEWLKPVPSNGYCHRGERKESE